AGVHRIQRHYGISASGAIQVQGLDQEQLAGFVAGVFLSGHEFSDNTGDQHQAGLSGGRSEGGAALFRWTESTIPTTVVSTGGSCGRNGKLASLPRTQ